MRQATGQSIYCVSDDKKQQTALRHSNGHCMCIRRLQESNYAALHSM
jgi:hypothetical protein